MPIKLMLLGTSYHLVINHQPERKTFIVHYYIPSFTLQLLESTGLFDTFSEEIYIWMKHLQAKVSVSQNRSDLLTFVSKVIMMYMNNPYPYMDRVADLVSEVVSMETGDAAIDLGKTKLDRQIEGTVTFCNEDKG